MGHHPPRPQKLNRILKNSNANKQLLLTIHSCIKKVHCTVFIIQILIEDITCVFHQDNNKAEATCLVLLTVITSLKKPHPDLCHH